MTWIQTFTGRRFFPLAPRAEDVCIEDIAHALAHTCRFCGHVREYYSVAQHSVIVSVHVPARLALMGLLHDAGEAYFPDVVTPVKPYIFASEFSEETEGDKVPFGLAETRILVAVLNALGAPYVSREDWRTIKLTDMAACMTEATQLMTDARVEEWGFKVKPLACGRIEPLCPRDAEAEFLKRYYELRAE